ncbi:SdrD B-like domain-containing protein [Janthinobacterium sp.]|uniref:SdrD B-like domain-containing protein n=1 Tax=Janthinobacterium sp. TaxID=1871054 RepID=UPI00293D8D8D|nr:SdrD B-like domain-containing protein [Janthinobacterium sp.]
MTTINLSTELHVCEDTNRTFDIRDLLTQAGYAVPGQLDISDFVVVLPNGDEVEGDTPLFGRIDGDTIYVRPGTMGVNWNGSFETYELVVNTAAGDSISLQLQVIIDPVNDAPAAADKSFDLLNGNGVTLSEGDFGFHDDVEHDGFKSVLITSLPVAGHLLLNGVAVASGVEIAIADIRAGHVVFVPDQNIAGSFALGFKVHDDGGTVGCNASDLSATPNYLTFKVPMAHLGDFVWHDANANGVQDAGEAGIAGVVVELKDAAGNVVASTTTDAAGAYHFDVNPGTYSVAVVTPAGYAATAQNQGGDAALDSNIDASGKTGLITLAPGETNNSIDAGLYKTAELGDRVWLDLNKNGVQDAGEAGVAGVKVTLLDASGHAVGSPLTTDANGNYLFTNLKPGTYSVQFEKTSLPAGYVFTGKDAGGNDNLDSDASVDGATAQVTLASGESNHSVDAGIVAPPATLGDRVWHDVNANGVQDAGEAGIGGVTVQLKDAAGAVVGSTVTDASGNYSFSVDPGTYSVAVVAPSGYISTVKNAGSDAAADSDVDAAGNSGTVTLAAGQNNPDLDAGLYKTAELGDRVWLDLNKNGVQDAGEAGVAGVKVTLLDASGHAVGSPLTTDANGNYLFTNLKPGTYSVQFEKTSLPAGYVFTGKDAGGNDNLDSDASTVDGGTAQVTLASGESNHSVDAGIVATPATLGDRVWHDVNANGVQDAGEAGIGGVTVQLKDAAGAVVGSTVTDASGNYSFSVDPGTYSVAVVAPSGYISTVKNAGSDVAADSDIDAAGNSGSVTLAAGQNNPTLDAGLYKTAELGDRVWLDTNKNGVQDAGEGGVAGVKVTLLDASGHAVGSPLTTDANGNYLFTNLKPGTYSVQFDKTTLPAGYTITGKDAGGNDALDSDANAADGKTAQTVLDSGESDRSWDMGVQSCAPPPQAHIGDRVWLDANANGVQDAGESGISGVTVQLKNSAGTVVSTTTTDGSGNYHFDVAAGTYSVAVKAPSGYYTSAKDVGANDAVDSDIDSTGNTAKFSVAAGETNNTLDAGLYQKAALGDKVWFDGNGNGVQDACETGVGCVTVNLLNSAGVVVASAVTDSNGNYMFSNLTPGAYSVAFVAPSGYMFTKQDVGSDSTDSDADAQGRTIQTVLVSGEIDRSWDAGLVKAVASIGDRVWEDKNFNGVQDAGESGVSGVTVKLLNAYNQVLATTTTNATGNYLFNGLNAGDYKVEVVKPSGYYYTKTNVGVDTADSDVDTSSGRTALTHLDAGENDLSWDAGLYRKASIGDKVWRDVNHDGIQEVNEEGIGGVKVALYDTANHLLATTYTNSNGNYNFGNLDPGSYYLQFDKTGVMFKGYNMNDWKWGVKNVGSNDQIDSDVHGDGISKANVTYTDATTLDSGENDMSWDATITPIVIDLNGDGIHTIARGDFHGSFDLLGNGHAIQSGWISGNDGFLAVDSNGNGRIDGIGELFGGASKGSGFAKLASFDSNGDGFVDAHDDKFAELRIWRDANSNGVTDAGELMSMHDAGVSSLTVHFTELPFLDANNNLHLERSSATLAGGKSVDMTDVYFNVDAKDAAQAGAHLPTMADLLRDGNALDKVIGQPAAPATVAAVNAAPVLDSHAQCDVADVLRRVLAHAAATEVAA